MGVGCQCSRGVDWHGVPEVVGRQVTLPEVLTNPDVRRGECDIKAFAYMPLGTLLIFSTDGDFLPLAMVQIERAASTGTLRGDVYVHRMFTKISEISLRKKRPRLEINRRLTHANDGSVAATSAEPRRNALPNIWDVLMEEQRGPGVREATDGHASGAGEVP